MRRRPRRGARWAAGLLLSAATLLVAAGCGTGTLVDTTKWYVSPSGNDHNDCHAATSACKTIQAAMDKAALTGDTVYLAAGTYVENIVVDKSLTLVGVGEPATIIDGNGEKTHLQTVHLEGANTMHIAVSLMNLAIRHGHAGGTGATIHGGGIYARGVDATLTNVAVTDNVAEGDGGGIYIDQNSTVALNNVTVDENTAQTRSGGGIFTSATLTMIGGEIRNNTARLGAGGSGGGLYTSGITSLTNVVIDGNLAQTGGGIYQGLASDGKTHLTILSATISNNHATALGGGIDSSFTDDESLFAALGYLMLTNSTVAHNSADGTAGGILNEHRAAAYLINDTISDNQSAMGGGIANGMGSSTVVAINITIAYNNAGQGGGILNTANFQIQNVLIAKNSGGNCSDYGSGAALNSAADISTDPSCHLTGPLDHDNVADPKIGTLSDNGGPTQTIPLLAGSPAINTGVAFLAPTVDQRGLTRNGDGLGVDIGAYEVAQKVMSGQANATIVTATPSPIIITLSQAGKCYAGPGTGSAVTAELPQGAQANILGRSGDGAWFYITHSGGFPCWIAALSGTVSGGDPSGAPVLAAGATETPTPTPTPTLTPTTPAPFPAVSVTPNHMYYRGTGCGEKQAQFKVQVGDPAKVAGVWLFVRLQEKGGSGVTAWSAALVMTRLGVDWYGYTLLAEDISDFQKFPDAWVQYQLVAYDKNFAHVAQSDVFSDVELSICNH